MMKLSLQSAKSQHFKLLCIGAHCDDIAIGCGGTILTLLDRIPAIEVVWAVMTSTEKRQAEERSAAAAFLGPSGTRQIIVKDWQDGYLPKYWGEVKDFFEELKRAIDPDLILTHFRDDRHQDHRIVSDLTWNTFRHHMILEYEIPKYDGDLGSPNVFVPLAEQRCREKARKIVESFPSQCGRQWFTEDVFVSLARLRGMEAASDSQFAEAFYCRKLLIG